MAPLTDTWANLALESGHCSATFHVLLRRSLIPGLDDQTPGSKSAPCLCLLPLWVTLSHLPLSPDHLCHMLSQSCIFCYWHGPLTVPLLLLMSYPFPNFVPPDLAACRVLSSGISDSHPWLYIRITWGALKKFLMFGPPSKFLFNWPGVGPAGADFCCSFALFILFYFLFLSHLGDSNMQ